MSFTVDGFFRAVLNEVFRLGFKPLQSECHSLGWTLGTVGYNRLQPGKGFSLASDGFALCTKGIRDSAVCTVASACVRKQELRAYCKG
jgi:hypothetical protein